LTDVTLANGKHSKAAGEATCQEAERFNEDCWHVKKLIATRAAVGVVMKDDISGKQTAE
jgi:hypothetical protein